MKPNSLLLVVTPFFLSWFQMATAESNGQDPRTLAQFNIKMAVISQDGKRVGDKLVKYVIFKMNEDWIVDWNEVYFSTIRDGEQQAVDLDMRHYSTEGGTIRNVKVSDGLASFDIRPDPTGEASIHVICKPAKEYFQTPTVKAEAVYPTVKILGVVHPKHTEEWVLTERIVLPSTEVYGHPLPTEKGLGKQ